MKLDEAFAGLDEFVETAEHVNVMVGADLGEALLPVLQRLVLGDEATEAFRDSAWESVPDLDGDVVLRPYDPTYKPDKHELLYLDLEDAPEVEEIVSAVADVSGAAEFEENETIVNHLKFYAVVVTDADQQAVFFRSYGPKKELSRKGGFALTKGQGQYNRIKKKVFLFDDEVDCFAWEGFLFIRNPYQFRRIFRYLEQLKERANEIIDLVTERVPISNEDEFRSAVAGQMQMLAKMSSIAAKPYLAGLTMEAIQLTIDEFELELDVVEEDGEDKLVFDPAPDKRWIILKLLDDDYLESVMTELKYESNSKISRSQA